MPDNLLVNSYDLFVDIVRSTFLGGKQNVNNRSYSLEPTLIRRYDFLRAEPEFGSKYEMNRLFADLPSDFESTAKSEMYRKKGGWIDKGYQEKKVKQFHIDKDYFVVPFMSEKPAIGIDTSSTYTETFVCIAFFDNYKAGYYYLENFLHIPKSTGGQPEFKWNKLNPQCRAAIVSDLDSLLQMSCQCVLMIRTNALKSPDEKLMDVFIKLIRGWFTNYKHKTADRLRLQKELFRRANEVSIHCDADFQPLVPGQIVKQFVKILSNGNDHVPSHAVKDSHESEPIQVTDILCGALKSLILEKDFGKIQPWEFDNKLKSKTTERTAKCYLWNNQDYPVIT